MEESNACSRNADMWLGWWIRGLQGIHMDGQKFQMNYFRR
jgi:hypothetical protein